MAAAALLLTPPGGASGDSSFDVTGLVNIRFTLPEEVLGFEVHATCIMRLNEKEGSGGSTPVNARAVCYQVATTDPDVPPPPPPPYGPLVFPVLIDVSGQPRWRATSASSFPADSPLSTPASPSASARSPQRPAAWRAARRR
jgi:hypothetical protein